MSESSVSQRDFEDSGADGQRLSAATGERLARQERRLRLLLMHLTGRALRARVELDDLVQEVWVRAITAASLPLESSADEQDTELWRFLSRLARNCVIDAARAIRAAKRGGKTARLQHSDWSLAGARASQVVASGWGPATQVRARELEHQLEARFLALPPEHQRVIGLRQFEGLSAREAAGRMGRSETAIHSLYRRALMAWQADDLFSDPRGESSRAPR